MLYKPELSHLSTFPNVPRRRQHAGHSSGNLLTAEKGNPFSPDFKKLLANPRHERYIPSALQMRG
jgi:hypothetical protein